MSSAAISRSLFLPILFGAVLCSCVTTGRRTFVIDRLPKDSIRLKPIDLKAYEEKYAEYDGVYLLREYVIEHAQRPPVKSNFSWDIYKMGTFRYIILNPDAEWLTTFRLDIKEEQELTAVYITVIAPDGSIRQFDKGDLRMEKDSDGDRVYKLAYPGIVKGSIVDEGYEIHYDPVVSQEVRHDIPLQFSIPCERLSVRYAYPRKWTIERKQLDSVRTIFYRSVDEEKNDLMVLTYDTVNVPAVTEEIYSPYLKEISNYLDVGLTRYKIGSNSSQPCAPESWKDYADSYKQYAIAKGSPKSKAIRKQVEKIVGEAKTPKEQMEKIVGWVQKEIAISWTQENEDFRDLLKSKRGNPYLICGLTRAMLENVGISSSLMLIHSAEDGYFDMNYHYWGALYQAGLWAEIDGEKYYLFPWIKSYPVDQIPAFFQGESAMVITSEGYGGFETLPYGSSAESKTESSYDAKIDDNGIMRVVETRELRGDDAYQMRRELDGLTKEKLEREVKDLLPYEGGEVKLENYEIEKLDEYALPLVIRITYTIENLVTLTPDEAIVRTEGLFAPATKRGIKVDAEKRKNPIRIYNDEQYVKHISLQVPKSWRLSEVPKPISEKNRFGEISATYTFAGNMLTVEHERALHRESGSASEIKDLLAIIGKKSKLNVPTLVFKVN